MRCRQKSTPNLGASTCSGLTARHVRHAHDLQGGGGGGEGRGKGEQKMHGGSAERNASHGVSSDLQPVEPRVEAAALISLGEATATRFTSHLQSGQMILARRMLNEFTMHVVWKMWVHGRRQASWPCAKSSKQMGHGSGKSSWSYDVAPLSNSMQPHFLEFPQELLGERHHQIHTAYTPKHSPPHTGLWIGTQALLKIARHCLPSPIPR